MRKKKVSSWWDLRVSFSCKISSRKAKASAHEIVVFDFEQYSTVLLNLGHRHTISFCGIGGHIYVSFLKEIRWFFFYSNGLQNVLVTRFCKRKCSHTNFFAYGMRKCHSNGTKKSSIDFFFFIMYKNWALVFSIIIM